MRGKKLLIIFLTIFITITITIIMFSESSNKAFRKQFDEFVSTPISIPYAILDKKNCNEFMDSLEYKKINFVFYNDSINCLNCTFNKLIAFLQENREELKNVRILHVISTNSRDSKNLYHKLCNLRLYGEVYFDTCNAFRKANPKFPKEKLFHTFLLDNDGKVIYVGNPTNNSKNEKVFWKTISYYKSGK